MDIFMIFGATCKIWVYFYGGFVRIFFYIPVSVNINIRLYVLWSYFFMALWKQLKANTIFYLQQCHLAEKLELALKVNLSKSIQFRLHYKPKPSEFQILYVLQETKTKGLRNFMSERIFWGPYFLTKGYDSFLAATADFHIHPPPLLAGTGGPAPESLNICWRLESQLFNTSCRSKVKEYSRAQTGNSFVCW